MAKKKFKITNCRNYNKALINRGLISFWLDDEAIQAWYESASRRRPQHFRCRSCKRVFQLTYSYEARKPSVKEQIVEMLHNGAGVRDTCQNTENRHQYRHTDIKKLSPRRITSASVAHADVALICEPDEQWSFVGSKAQQHWSVSGYINR